MRAVAYIRVSTGRQADQGMSLEIQSAAAARFCEERGWDLVDMFVDAGERGGKWDRPELQRLLADFPNDRRRRRQNAAPFDILLTYKLDRIARSSIDTHEIIGRLERAGVGFRSITEPTIDTTTPIGRVFLSVTSAFAEMERAALSARITPAMQAKTDRGQWVGRAPLGYRLEAKQLVFDETMTREGITIAELTRQVFHAYAREGSGILGISERITAALGGGRNPGSRGFGSSQVSRMLRRRTYVGDIQWNGTVYPGGHEPLIARSTWDAAQQRLDSVPARRNKSDSCYLLTGILRCRLCSGPMVGHSSRNRQRGTEYVYRRYECNWDRSNEHRRAAALPLKGTHAAVFRLLRHHLDGGAGDAPLMEFAEPVLADATQGIRRRLETISEQLDRLVDQLSRGVLGEQEFGRARHRLISEREELERSLTNTPTPRRAAPGRIRQTIRTTMDLVEDPEATADLKREALSLLLDTVTVERDGQTYIPSIVFRAPGASP